MKVLLDLNVVLDVVLNRHPWVVESARVWNAHQSGQIAGWLVATELTNLFYIVRKIAGEAAARTAVRVCLETFDILPVDQPALELAARLAGIDFEDNVCIACATAAGLDLIVTRDPSGFAQAAIAAISPADLIVKLGEDETGR